MKCRIELSLRLVAVCLLISGSTALTAQSAIQLFGPVDVRLSQTGTGSGSTANNFNSSTLNLTCPALPITAILSSSPDGTGNVLVDNNIDVTVTADTTVTGPTNVCVGGVNGSPAGPFQNCFTTGYQTPAGQGTLTGQDPDNFVSTGGVPPIDISSSLLPGPLQLKVDLQDEFYGPGFYLASSSIYLVTNCTQGSVTGPALVTGNPIPATNPTPAQLAQDFSFNPTTGQSIGFTYDLTTAEAASTLTIADGTIPQVADMPLDPTVYQTTYVPGTSFATSSCLIHTGETINGVPACKLYTLECKIGTGATATGAQCPISTQPNELFQDAFDGPAFSLQDIPTPGGPTFHEGIGFLMASEGWTGGPCTYDPAANLQSTPCPQNLLTSFTSTTAPTPAVALASGSRIAASAIKSKAATTGIKSLATAAATSSADYTSSGRTTHPNSTFITVAQVPEDLTTVSVAGQNAAYWINTSTASITLSSQPPVLSGTTLPGAASFVPSPILNISYGLTAASAVPTPGDPSLNDTVLSSGVTCPTQANPTGVPAATFTPGAFSISGLADGNYLLHYYAQDCAGTEELKFLQDASGNWSTNFYTYPINVDTTAPVASTPTLSPTTTGSYTVGQPITASFNCTDALSGVVSCGGITFAQGVSSTGSLTTTIVPTSTGLQTFVVKAIDAAGNQSSSQVSYQVVSPYDSQIQVNVNPTTATYPQPATVTVAVVPATTATPAVKSGAVRAASGRVVANQAAAAATAPTGTVQILDGTKILSSLHLSSAGKATYVLAGLNAGPHSITVSYSGDASNPAGVSAPVIFTVQPAQPQISVLCSSSPLTYGQNFACAASVNAPILPAQGSITYTLRQRHGDNRSTHFGRWPLHHSLSPPSERTPSSYPTPLRETTSQRLRRRLSSPSQQQL